MGFNPLCRRCDDLSDHVQAKRLRDERDAGHALKVPRTEKGGRKGMVPPTAFELEGVPIRRKESDEGKRRVADGLAMDEERGAYPLTRDVVKGAPANVN